MKKFMILCLTAIIPFILVWIGSPLSGLSYNPVHIFRTDAFWGFSVIYWFIWICLSPVIIDIINEVHSNTSAK